MPGFRRRPLQIDTHPQPQRQALWTSVAKLVTGVLLIWVSIALLRICEQDVVAWWHRGEYQATELEVEFAHNPGKRPGYVEGRVLADGAVLRISPIPEELYERTTPPAAVRRLLSQEKIKWRRVPIWYAADARGLITDARAITRGSERTFENGRGVLTSIILEVVTLVGGVFLAVSGWRRLRWFKSVNAASQTSC